MSDLATSLMVLLIFITSYVSCMPRFYLKPHPSSFRLR